MKTNNAYERAIKTIVQFEREIAGLVSVNGTLFAESVTGSFIHFAGDDSYTVILKTKDCLQKISCTPENGENLCTSDDFSVWKDILKKNRFMDVQKNDGSLVSKKYHSWMLIPVSVKKEIVIAVVVARPKGNYHHSEIKAGEELGIYFTQVLRNIRIKNKKSSAIADDARHGILLHTQENLGSNQAEWNGLARITDYGARTGSDLAKAWRNGDESIFVCACDITASEMDRQIGLIYLDTWFSILSQTSLEIKNMLQRLNYDMVTRDAECYASIALIRFIRKSLKAEISGCGNTSIVYFSHDMMDAQCYSFGPALGLNKDNEIKTYLLTVKPGDILCAYTDGISGTRKKNGDLFGDDTVCEIVKKNYFLSGADLAEKIFSVLKEKEEKGVNTDDRTLQVLKIE